MNDNISNVVENAKFILKDLIQGDESITKRNDFDELTFEDIRQSIKLITNDPRLNENQKSYMMHNLWRIHYRQKPPSIEEFLTSEWIGPTALSVYPHIRNDLSKFWAPDSYARNLILSPCIGYGKSTATAISVLYTMVHMNLLRNSKQFFGISEASSIVAVLGSFTLGKVKQTLLKPFLNILRSSPKFRRVKQDDKVEIAQEEEDRDGSNRIVFTTASKMDGALQFSHDLNILIVSDIESLLGLSIITGALTEVSFFMGKGISPDDINQMYNDLKARVWNRFGHRYFATTIIDSSPNNFDSPIDKYVFTGEAEKDPRNMVVKSTHWDVYKTLKPESYQKWIETGETFPVFRGSGSKSPLIIDESARELYFPEDVINVPIDLKRIFEADLSKAVKDYAGYPSGGNDKLIGNYSILDNLFNNSLKNVYSYIKAPADKNPNRLIWDQVYRNFFIEVGPNNFEFYRSAKEQRFIALDLSESGDVASISCVHPEMNNKGEIVIIGDFTIAIVPGKERINLSAIESFILDLKRIGKLNIVSVTADQYQSSTMIQNLKREELESERLSVDIDTAPYLVVISWMKNNRIKVGRNIFLKNNLKSIQEFKLESGKKKIDHVKGKLVNDDNGVWETSLMGINAKDISDSFTAACFKCISVYTGIPRYQWIDTNNEKESNEILKERAFKNIYEKYNFKPVIY